MNAHTEHTATLARVIADDQRCQCTGACVNGREPCTCGLHMPCIPAEACTELGSYLDDVQEPGTPWNGWELLGAVGLGAALVLACWVPYPL
jgi:hypothetical protein